MAKASSPKKVRAGIVGVTGYAGQELLGLLLAHPRVRVTYLANSGRSDPAPALRHFGKLPVKAEPFDAVACASACDAAFLCLPHKVSMESVPDLLEAGLTVIDLSADFRLKNPAVYESAYGIPHTAPALLRKAVYGLPELHRALRGARLVAVPGCYPTGALLALAPLAKGRMLSGRAIIDSKSGVTGAGREAKGDLMYCEVNEGAKAYGVFSHRHAPEIGQELAVLAGSAVRFTFTPHLVPMNRGILSTVHVELRKPSTSAALSALFARFYRGAPFVRVLHEGLPDTNSVRGTNFCDIGCAVRGKEAVIVSALDNLVKGAAGQAVQAFNAAKGFPQVEGLSTVRGAP